MPISIPPEDDAERTPVPDACPHCGQAQRRVPGLDEREGGNLSGSTLQCTNPKCMAQDRE